MGEIKLNENFQLWLFSLMPADKRNGINQICPSTIHSARAAKCCSNQTDCRPAFDI